MFQAMLMINQFAGCLAILAGCDNWIKLDGYKWIKLDGLLVESAAIKKLCYISESFSN
jgi:hypothetical protein